MFLVGNANKRCTGCAPRHSSNSHSNLFSVSCFVFSLRKRVMNYTFTLIILCGNLSLFVSYSMLISRTWWLLFKEHPTCITLSLVFIILCGNLNLFGSYTMLISRTWWLSFKEHPTSITISLLFNILCGKRRLYVSYTMLISPKKAKIVMSIAANIQTQYGIMADLRSKPRHQCVIIMIIIVIIIIIINDFYTALNLEGVSALQINTVFLTVDGLLRDFSYPFSGFKLASY